MKMKHLIVIISILSILVSTPTAVAQSGIVFTSPDGEDYERGDELTISATSYSGDSEWTLQIQRGETVVWVDQGNSLGSVEYTLEIPSTWEKGSYKIYVNGDKSSPVIAEFYLDVPSSVGTPSGGGTTTPPPDDTITPPEVEAQETEEATDTLKDLDDDDAAYILIQINKTKAKEILEEMDEGNASKIAEAAVKAGYSDDIAKIINDMEDQKGAGVLLGLNTTSGASVVGRMASLNLNEAAKTVEEAVKRRLQDTDPEKSQETLDRIAKILDGTSTESLVDIFVEIANLPETPSTVATVMTVMQLTKVYDVVTAWINVGDLDELGLVFGYFEPEFLGTIYTGMNTEERNTLFPYLSAETVAMLPELGEFDLSGLSITPETIQVGETVSISVNAENIGTEAGSYVVNLKIDGATIETEELSLPVGADETVTWTLSESTPGTYDVDVNGLTGSFTVEAVPLTPANIIYESISVSSSSIKVGETVTVTVTVENTGEESGSETIQLYIDDMMNDSSSVSVSGEDSETVTFTVTLDEAGTYTLEAGDKSTTITVTEPVPDEPPSTFSWTYAIVAVVIIAAAAYIYMQQQKQ